MPLTSISPPTPFNRSLSSVLVPLSAPPPPSILLSYLHHHPHHSSETSYVCISGPMEDLETGVRGYKDRTGMWRDGEGGGVIVTLLMEGKGGEKEKAQDDAASDDDKLTTKSKYNPKTKVVSSKGLNAEDEDVKNLVQYISTSISTGVPTSTLYSTLRTGLYNVTLSSIPHTPSFILSPTPNAPTVATNLPNLTITIPTPTLSTTATIILVPPHTPLYTPSILPVLLKRAFMLLAVILFSLRLLPPTTCVDLVESRVHQGFCGILNGEGGMWGVGATVMGIYGSRWMERRQAAGDVIKRLKEGFRKEVEGREQTPSAQQSKRKKGKKKKQ